MRKSLVVPLSIVLVCGGVSAGFRPASAATAYNVSQIAALANGAAAYGLSPDRTQIAGRLIVAPNTRAFVHANGVTSDLGTSPGFTSSQGRDVNDSGQVVGFLSNSTAGFDPTDRAFYRSGNSGLVQMPTLGGAGFTHAYGVNNAGVAVGVSGFQPFQYTLGTNALTQLPTPSGGDGFGRAFAINNAGNIVGSANASGVRKPTLWSGGVGTFLNTPAGATNAEATIINESGVIAGTATYANGTRAFLYDAGGTPIDMGTLGGSYNFSEVFDINNARQAVGTSRLAASPFTSEPFLYENGTMVNLNTLLPANSGWVLQRAISINDLGEITGTGTFNGSPSGFKLTPVPEPAGVAMVMLLAVRGVLRRRRC